MKMKMKNEKLKMKNDMTSVMAVVTVVVEYYYF